MINRADPQVEFKGISKSYGDVVVLKDFNLIIEKGEYVVLLGPSGSGKTTALSMVGGFTEPSGGRVFLGGRDVTNLPANRRECATVFQDYALFPHMTVEGNINFGLAMQKVPRRERKDRINEVLDLVGLSGFGDRKIQNMSGGQRQRIALARALATRPSVLLLDEPLGALDLKIRRQMQEELASIHARVGTTFMHVTHDQEEAISIADKIILLSEGKINDMGAPEEMYRRPQTAFSATFMGDSNIIKGRCASSYDANTIDVETEYGDLRVSGQAQVGREVQLCVRPENIQIGNMDAAQIGLGTARITSMLFHGSFVRLRAAAGNQYEHDLLVEMPTYDHPEVGDEITLTVRPEDLVLLED